MAKVQDVMTRDPACCTPEDGVIECAKMMAREDVGVIPVVESRDTRRLVGVVTDRDLAMEVIAEGKNPETCTVGDCMSDELVVCRPHDDLDEALGLMQEHQIRRVMVVDEDFSVVGVVAQADIAKAAGAREVKQTVEEISRPGGSA